MSNARIQFSLASEEVWNAYNPLLKEGEIVTVLKANKKVKLVQGKLGGATYSESTVIWDEDEAQAIMSRTEAAAVTATAQATAASDSASNAAASQSAAAMSATNAKASESAAKNSATSAASSASTASTQAGKAAENARLAEGYKTAAETAKSNASLYAANAKADSEKATASKEAAQSAATTASNFANASRSSANEARTYRDNAKNYSENVNVFIPSVSSAGVLSWTNKAGLTNPASVNIKGAKGDTGTAASITIGSVTTGAAGSNASVTNSGTASNAVLNFMLPRGKDGKDGGITVDAALSDTSINPVQNKVVTKAFNELISADGVLTIPSSVGAYVTKLATDSLTIINDVTQTIIEQSADGEHWETLFDSTSNTENDAFKLAYINGLEWPHLIGISKGYIARITFATHKSTYFSNIAIFMKIINADDASIENPYKCYAGYNSLKGSLLASGTIMTYGSTPSVSFSKHAAFNIVRYVFNEDKKNLDLFFQGVYCKGTEPYRNVLKYDYNKERTVTSFDIEAPHFIGTAQKAVQDGNGNIISRTYANTLFGNSWVGKQDFAEVKLGYETYSSPVGGGGGNTPQLSVMHYRVTKAFNLDLSHLSTALEIEASTVFTAYIESNGDYTLTIHNAGTIKYIGSASDLAITSAGLLLNILMMKDAEGNVTSIVQASKLEGGA